MRSAVIPLKNLSHVKTRLAGYLSLEDRISLCLGMLNRLILLLSSAPEIDAVFEADTTIPLLSEEPGWERTQVSDPLFENGVSYAFAVYRRK